MARPVSIAQAAEAKRRRPGQDRTHTEIYDRIGLIETAGKNTRNEVDRMVLVVQRVETKMDKVLSVIGGEAEDEYGKPTGTGIIGRMMRFEASVQRRFRLYDRWVAWATGAGATATIAGVVLWWLLSDKLGHIFR